MCTRTIILLLLLVASLGGCLSKKKDVDKEEKPTILFLAYSYDDTFVSDLGRNIEKAAKNRAILTSADSRNDQDIQNELLSSYLEQGIDAAIINLVDRSKADAVIHEFKIRNVPVVFINRQPDEKVINSWKSAYYVGTNGLESGEMSVEILLDYFQTNRNYDINEDGVIQYVTITGSPGHQDTVYRTQAYTEAFHHSKSGGGLAGEEIGRISGFWNKGIAKDKMDELLPTVQNRIEAVLANNDDMALGAIQAMEEAGYFSERGRSIPVVGIDGTEAALEAIASQKLVGTVLNNTVSQGTDAVYIAIALANNTDPAADTSVHLTSFDGQHRGRYIWVPHEKITFLNYRGYMKMNKDKELADINLIGNSSDGSGSLNGM